MSYEQVQKSRTNRKLDMVYVMGGCCQCCGYHRDVHALEFHHINPAEKDFSFNKAESIGWETIKKNYQNVFWYALIAIEKFILVLLLKNYILHLLKKELTKFQPALIV